MLGSITAAHFVAMGLGWEVKRVMMEVFRVAMAAAPTASSNPHTSAMILTLMPATAQSVWISAKFAVIIIHAQTVQLCIPMIQLFLLVPSIAQWLATVQPASTMLQLLRLNAQPVWLGTQL